MAKDKRAIMLKIGDSTFDKIQAYYIDPEKYALSETNEEIRKRWITVMTLQLNGYQKFKIVNMLVKDFGLSESQAYIDIRNAENIFGSINKTDVEAEKQIWKEWIKEIRLRAKRKGDLKSELKAADLYAKYSEFGMDNPEFNPDKLIAKEIQIIVQPKLLTMLKEMIGKGVVDFNNLDATDIDHEEIK